MLLLRSDHNYVTIHILEWNFHSLCLKGQYLISSGKQYYKSFIVRVLWKSSEYFSEFIDTWYSNINRQPKLSTIRILGL